MNEGEPEFDTLAGFILHQLKRVQQVTDWNGKALISR